jgi:hypothetical protein
MMRGIVSKWGQAPASCSKNSLVWSTRAGACPHFETMQRGVPASGLGTPPEKISLELAVAELQLAGGRGAKPMWCGKLTEWRNARQGVAR